MISIVVVVAAAALIALVRARSGARARETVRQRLTLDTDGIVVGATTIDLPTDGGRAVLMLHGFGDTPQTLEYLAAYVHAQGWAVRAPLLPGHGRTLDELRDRAGSGGASLEDTFLELVAQRVDAAPP